MKILIFDDNSVDVELMVATMTRAGLAFDWQSAGTVAEFLSLLSADFDLILLDYTLPDYDALQALALIKKRQIDVPCIIISGTIGEERAVECLHRGAVDYLLKDRLGRLTQAVRSALEAHAAKVAQRAAEQELRNTVIQLEQRNAELERFSYTISHELRTPLVTVSGFLGLLKEILSPECLARSSTEFRFLEEAVDTLRKRLDLLLNLVRAGTVRAEAEALDLDQLVRRQVATLEGRFKEQRPQISIQAGLPRVIANEVSLGEVLENLLENAVKYMGDQPQPHIEIGGRLEDGMAICFVRDNGIGIDPGYQDRIFRLFEQLNPSVEGEGVGLPLVRRILETLHGKIWTESAGQGQGCTFFFTLPAAEDAASGA